MCGCFYCCYEFSAVTTVSHNMNVSYTDDVVNMAGILHITNTMYSIDTIINRVLVYMWRVLYILTQNCSSAIVIIIIYINSYVESQGQVHFLRFWDSFVRDQVLRLTVSCLLDVLLWNISSGSCSLWWCPVMAACDGALWWCPVIVFFLL